MHSKREQGRESDPWSKHTVDAVRGHSQAGYTTQPRKKNPRTCGVEEEHSGNNEGNEGVLTERERGVVPTLMVHIEKGVELFW